MKNTEIARVFLDIADLLELKGENRFKIRAYQRAAKTIEFLPKEVEVFISEGGNLKDIPGVGEAIAKKTEELVTTGQMQYYQDLREEFPEGVTDLMEIPGVGPKTAKKLSDMGVKSVDELETAIKDGRVADMSGLGGKTAENILNQIQALRRKDRRIPIGEALPVVEEILDELRNVPGIKNLIAAGSLRRFRETVGDIDLMGTADDPEGVIKYFVALPQVAEILAQGPTKASVLLPRGLQVDLRIVEHDSFGSLLQYFTGSQQHNVVLRHRGQNQGLKISEYGITDLASGKLEKYQTEEDLYYRLGLQYMPPEIREGQDEIALAEKGKIPKLIELEDIRGDFHTHSNWSDGVDSIEDMALEAKSMGYQYIAVTDHSGGLGIAHGLSEERLRKQMDEIKQLNSRLKGIHILSGIEVDIRADGSLDLSHEVLKDLDIVIAAVHSGMNQSEEKMTKRVIAAIYNPDVDIIAHPTCRLLGDREPVAIDMEAVFKAAAEYNKILEINAMPSRLDLKDIHIHRANELGIKLAMGTDAHSVLQLDIMRFGIGIARRGWCQRKHVLNTRPAKEIIEYLKKA